MAAVPWFIHWNPLFSRIVSGALITVFSFVAIILTGDRLKLSSDPGERFDSMVSARSLVEPWTRTKAALALASCDGKPVENM